jgi:hypothetical protein
LYNVTKNNLLLVMNSNLSSHLLSVARMMKEFIRVQIMGCRLCRPDTMNTKRNPKLVLNHFLLSLSSICRKTWPIPIHKKSNNKYTTSFHSIFAPRDGLGMNGMNVKSITLNISQYSKYYKMKIVWNIRIFL